MGNKDETAPETLDTRPHHLPTDRLAQIGDFFALEPTIPDEGTWITVTELLVDDEAVAELITSTAARLGTTDQAIAASVLQQGWASRLTSSWAGCIHLVGCAPDLHPDLVARSTRQARGRPRFALRAVRWLSPIAAWQRLYADHLGVLAVALNRHVRIGRRLLAGNTASSLAGTYETLHRHGTTTVRQLLELDWSTPADMVGLGTWSSGPNPQFRRTSCCGYERIPGKARCGDCSLDRTGASRR